MLIRVGKAKRHPGLRLLRRKMTVQRCSLGSPGTCSTRETAGTAARSSAVAVTMTLTVTARRRREVGSGQDGMTALANIWGVLLVLSTRPGVLL